MCHVVQWVTSDIILKIAPFANCAFCVKAFIYSQSLKLRPDIYFSSDKSEYEQKVPSCYHQAVYQWCCSHATFLEELH